MKQLTLIQLECVPGGHYDCQSAIETLWYAGQYIEGSFGNGIKAGSALVALLEANKACESLGYSEFLDAKDAAYKFINSKNNW